VAAKLDFGERQGQPDTVEMMSALGQKQTLILRSDDARFTFKADIEATQTDVCFVPKADICSLDDDVHALQKSVWDTEAYGLCSLEIDG
jgi:hypothetical protein